MRRFFTLMALSAVAACSSSNKGRDPLSVGGNPDVTGHYLGVAQYGRFHNGPNKMAVRIYLHPVQAEPGSYNVVIHEYPNLLHMAPQYVAANKAPKVNKVIGYLNEISRKISAHRAEPGVKPGTLAVYPLRIEGQSIVVDRRSAPRTLTLSANRAEPMGGAVLSRGDSDKEPETFFPSKNDEKYRGLQYELTHKTYNLAKLDSTWRKEFLPGPYFSAYGKFGDVVLRLSRSGGEETAEFLVNVRREGLSKRKAKKREKVFTNKHSAFLEGRYRVSEPQDGMFLFTPVGGGHTHVEQVTSRIGLFIDVFDATKSLGQDVVELAMINPDDPEDFLMYYEDPTNGEGTGN